MNVTGRGTQVVREFSVKIPLIRLSLLRLSSVFSSKKNSPAKPRFFAQILLKCQVREQLRVLRFGFLQDGDVGIGVFPEGK